MDTCKGWDGKRALRDRQDDTTGNNNQKSEILIYFSHFNLQAR